MLEAQLTAAAKSRTRSAVIFGSAYGTEGLVRDPALGPLLVISAGGILIEILAERAVLLPPVTRPVALKGVRRLARDLGDAIGALDINPLTCGPHGALAVDALLIPAERI